MKILFIAPHSLVPVDSGNKHLSANLVRVVSERATVDLALIIGPGSVSQEVVARNRAMFPSVRRIVTLQRPAGRSLLAERVRAIMRGYHPVLGKYAPTGITALGTVLSGERYDIVHCDMFWTVAYRNCVPHRKTLLVASDAYSLAASRARSLSRSRWWAWATAVHEILVHRIEEKEYPEFDLVYAVSEEDVKYLTEISGSNVSLLRLPIGEEFVKAPIAARLAKPNGILCTGSFDHPVVAQGLSDFLTRSVPQIRSAVPDVPVTILGRKPASNVDQIIRELPSVKLIPYVNDYIGFLRQDWVYVYPQRCGSGVQTKVQQAMALGLPVAGFDVAFNGLAVRPAEHCYVCVGYEEIAARVIDLLRSTELRDAVGRAARTHIASVCDARIIGAELISSYIKLMQESDGTRAEFR